MLDELKPTTKEKAELVMATLSTKGWLILQEYLTKQLESYTIQLKATQDNHRFIQGQVSTYEEINRKIKEFSDAATKRKK